MTYPPDFTRPRYKEAAATQAAACIAGLSVQHRAVVQAGGCAGLWPKALAAQFAHVYTFEPAITNWPYLTANLADVPNVTAYPWALGDTTRGVSLDRPKPKAGLWRVAGDGDIPMRPLDDVLAGVPVDALVLDVEGSEVAALNGAARLIAAYRPLLWLECLEHADAITAWLVAHDYTPPRRGLDGDWYSVHTSQSH